MSPVETTDLLQEDNKGEGVTLSVVMPCYNEHETLREIVRQVLATPYDLELIIVDDGSTDGSRDILADLEGAHPEIRVVLQPENRGKGAAGKAP